MQVIMILLGLAGMYLFAVLRRLRKPASAPRSFQVRDQALPIIRRSYTDGHMRPEAATEPDSDDSSGPHVTFAEGSHTEDTTAEPLPAWEGLETGPIFVLGPEGEDGSPCEYFATPPERTVEKKIADEDWGPAYDYPDEEEPTVTDITEEEERAVAAFDVRAFR